VTNKRKRTAASEGDRVTLGWRKNPVLAEIFDGCPDEMVNDTIKLAFMWISSGSQCNLGELCRMLVSGEPMEAFVATLSDKAKERFSRQQGGSSES
jgi:hypothetical protein